MSGLAELWNLGGRVFSLDAPGWWFPLWLVAAALTLAALLFVTGVYVLVGTAVVFVKVAWFMLTAILRIV